MVWPVIGRLFGGLAFGAAAEATSQPGFMDKASGWMYKASGGLIGSQHKKPTVGNTGDPNNSAAAQAGNDGGGDSKTAEGSQGQDSDKDQPKPDKEKSGGKQRPKKTLMDRAKSTLGLDGGKGLGGEDPTEETEKKGFLQTLIAFHAAIAAAFTGWAMLGSRGSQNEGEAQASNEPQVPAEQTQQQPPDAPQGREVVANAGNPHPSIDPSEMPEVKFKEAGVAGQEEVRLAAKGGQDVEAPEGVTPEGRTSEAKGRGADV